MAALPGSAPRAFRAKGLDAAYGLYFGHGKVRDLPLVFSEAMAAICGQTYCTSTAGSPKAPNLYNVFMCGIVGYIGTRKAVPIILEGLKRLEYRGYDSAGLAVYCDDNDLAVRRASGKLRNLEDAIRLNPVDGAYGIGHTRWATHGRPTEENAHPHRDCKGDIVVVHNGIVENYLALKKALQDEGHAFKTETDTEVIAHLVEKHFRGQPGKRRARHREGTARACSRWPWSRSSIRTRSWPRAWARRW